MSRSDHVAIALADGAYVLPPVAVEELRALQRDVQRAQLDHADAVVAFDCACRRVRRELVREYGVDALASIELSPDLSRAVVAP